MEKKLKSWQGWLLFGGSMVVVFVLGLCVSALMERRAEVASIFNNRKNVIKGIEARNELFKNDFPREYQTWTETAKTDFESEFNGNIAVDALEKRPEMVILWEPDGDCDRKAGCGRNRQYGKRCQDTCRQDVCRYQYRQHAGSL